jgi:long-chain acyl-CoA synthetase
VTPHLLPYLEHVGLHRDDVPSLRGLLVSSAPLPTDVARRFEEATELPLVHGWGLSEFTNLACCTDPFTGDDERRALLYDEDVPSVGTPLDGVEVSVRGEWGERRSEGERGELCVRGRSRMLGYFDDVAATVRALYGDWLRTGDQGYFRVRDGRARYYVSGRLEEVVVRGHKKHSPIAVENRLIADVPELSGHVAVLGFPHRVQGEELGAYVELDALTDTVTARLVGAIERLPDGQRPKVILHGTQPIPRTQGGQVQRARLQALFEHYDDCGDATRVERVCYD